MQALLRSLWDEPMIWLRHWNVRMPVAATRLDRALQRLVELFLCTPPTIEMTHEALYCWPDEPGLAFQYRHMSRAQRRLVLQCVARRHDHFEIVDERPPHIDPRWFHCQRYLLYDTDVPRFPGERWARDLVVLMIEAGQHTMVPTMRALLPRVPHPFARIRLVRALDSRDVARALHDLNVSEEKTTTTTP